MLYVLIALAMSPYINRYYLSSIAIFAAAWLIISLPLISRCVNRRIRFAWLFLLYILILRLIGYSSVALGNYSSDVVTVVIMSAMIYICNFCDVNDIRNIGHIGIGIIAVNTIDNIYIYLRYPGIDEYTPFIERLTLNYGRINVFGTQYALVLVFLLLALIITFNLMHKKTKMITLSVMIMCIYIIFFGVARATAIITLLTALFCLIVYRSLEKMERGSRYLIVYSVIIVVLLLLIFWQPFFQTLASIMPNERISTRFKNLSELFRYKLSDDMSGNSLLMRMNMLVLDLKYWLTNIKTFIIGNGYHRENARTVIEFTIINKSSGHTTVGDTLARYGMVGGIFLYYFIRQLTQVYKFAFSNFGKRGKILEIVFVNLILVNSVANTFFETQVITALMLIIPCYVYGMSVPKTGGEKKDVNG